MHQQQYCNILLQQQDHLQHDLLVQHEMEYCLDQPCDQLFQEIGELVTAGFSVIQSTGHPSSIIKP